MPAEPPDGRKVKSGPLTAVEATDRHERAKDYLSPAEVARLLDATKAGRHGTLGLQLERSGPSSLWPMAAVPTAVPGVEEGGARRLTGLFRHALPGTLAVLSPPGLRPRAGIVTLAGAILAG